MPITNYIYTHADVSEDIIKTDGYQQYMRQLKAFISDRQVFGTETIYIDPNYKPRYAVQFKYKGYIDVDLLISPVWWSDNPSDPTTFFRFLRDIECQTTTWKSCTG